LLSRCQSLVKAEFRKGKHDTEQGLAVLFEIQMKLRSDLRRITSMEKIVTDEVSEQRALEVHSKKLRDQTTAGVAQARANERAQLLTPLQHKYTLLADMLKQVDLEVNVLLKPKVTARKSPSARSDSAASTRAASSRSATMPRPSRLPELLAGAPSTTPLSSTPSSVPVIALSSPIVVASPSCTAAVTLSSSTPLDLASPSLSAPPSELSSTPTPLSDLPSPDPSVLATFSPSSAAVTDLASPASEFEPVVAIHTAGNLEDKFMDG